MNLITHLNQAMKLSEKVRPKVGGFPYLAECLRQKGFIKNTWYLPSTDSFYFSADDSLVIPGQSLLENNSSCPQFSKKELVRILRMDQAGKTSFPEFLVNAWNAGVVRYEVDLLNRSVVYYGANKEEYKEDYPSVSID